MRLKPKRLARLTWDELDHLQSGADVALQKSLIGSRLVAVQIVNMLAEKQVKPPDYIYLPAVDGPPAGAKPLNADWLARMKAKHGDKLELK